MSILNLILLLLLLLHLASAGRPDGTNATKGAKGSKKEEQEEEEEDDIQVIEQDDIWLFKEKMTTISGGKNNKWDIRSDFPVTSLNIVDQDASSANQPIKGNDVVIVIKSNCPRYEIPPISVKYDDQSLSVTWKRGGGGPNNKTQTDSDAYDQVDYDTFLEPSSFEAKWQHQGVAGYGGVCLDKNYMGLVNMKPSGGSNSDTFMGAPPKEEEEDHFMGAPMKEDTPPQQQPEEDIPFGAPAKENNAPQEEIPYGAPAKEGNSGQRRSNLRPSSSSSEEEEEEEEEVQPTPVVPPPATPATPSTPASSSSTTRMEKVPRRTWTSNVVVMDRESSEEEEETWTSDVVRMTRNGNNGGKRRRLGGRQLRQHVVTRTKEEEDTASTEDDAEEEEEEEETGDDADADAADTDGADDPPARFRSRGGTWGGGGGSSSSSSSDATANTGFITSREPVRTSSNINGLRQNPDEEEVSVEDDSDDGPGKGSVYRNAKDRHNMTACVVNVEILHSGCLDDKAAADGTAEGRTWSPRIIKAPIVREISVRELPAVNASEPDESCSFNYTADLKFPIENEFVHFTGNKTEDNSTSTSSSSSVESIEESPEDERMLLVDLPQPSCSSLLA